MWYKSFVAKVKKSSFLKSAVLPEHYPPADCPEVVIAGRSNAGKSTFINGVLGRKLARTSAEPGKTTELNFYSVNEAYRLVDIPGYGYAKRSGRAVRTWQKMIENYLSMRATLVGAVLVMDIRRDWTEQEDELTRWLSSVGQETLIVLTKADKLSRSQREKRKQTISRQSEKNLIFYSSMKESESYENIEDFIYTNWVNK